MQAGEQHCHPGCQYKQQHIFHRQGDLREDTAQLRQQRLDLQDGHRRERPGQIDNLLIVTRRQIEAGQVSRRQILQGAWLEDHEEVRLEVVPVDLPQAGDFRLAIGAADGEDQMVAEFELQALGDFALHRDSGNLIRCLLRPPVARSEFVARRQVRCPGQAQVTLDRPVSGRLFGDDLLHRFAVDADQSPRHHGV
ncbi:hypothetical protein D3C71_1131940 [compost metagenome]